MGRGDTHKSFTQTVTAVLDEDYVILDKEYELRKLKSDVKMVSDIAFLHLTEELMVEYEKFCKENSGITQPNTIGRMMKITTPDDVFPQLKRGKSRFTYMVNDCLIRSVKSWCARTDAFNGESEKYISQGYKRTANANKPRSKASKMCLSSVDKQYAYILNEPSIDEYIELYMLIDGEWRILIFNFDEKRFSDSYKVSLPDIVVDANGELTFHFSAMHRPVYPKFSDKYVMSVDVGVNSYVTASVVDVKTGKVVQSTNLSGSVRSLHNKTKKASVQVSSLQKQGRKKEAESHRKSNVSRKREMAIRAAQEIAQLSHEYGNAIIVVEDLSWIKDTMSNGRWNRGELTKWVNHYAEFNGTRVVKVNCKNTSQTCPGCHKSVVHPKWKISICKNRECSRYDVIQDRDVAATEMIARAFIYSTTGKSLKKYVSSRNKSKNLVESFPQRSPNVKNRKGLRADRTKNIPTPKMIKKKKKNNIWVIKKNGGEVITAESKKLRSAHVTEGKGVSCKDLGKSMTVKSTVGRISETKTKRNFSF